MKAEKLGGIFIAIVFGLVLTWLIFIPHIKYSGLIPSLNRKIEKVLKNPALFETQVTQIFFWEYDKPGRTVPFEVDSQIISVIAEITTHEKKKDGFVNMKEPETFVLSFFSDNTFFLNCECAWDKIKKIMEIRFDDTGGNMKNGFFAIDDNTAERLFSYLY